jgi:CheY-like chemotaxis protein
MKPVKQSDLHRAIVRAVYRIPKVPSQADAIDDDMTSLRPLSVLLVEDGLTNRMLAIALLKSWGHATTVAENGQEAIDLWKNKSFDLILMDVQMPIMDGLTATRLIREQEKQAGMGDHIPIIAMTARAMKGDREKCLKSGMDGYVSKPIRQQALHDAIRPLV